VLLQPLLSCWLWLSFSQDKRQHEFICKKTLNQSQQSSSTVEEQHEDCAPNQMVNAKYTPQFGVPIWRPTPRAALKLGCELMWSTLATGASRNQRSDHI